MITLGLADDEPLFTAGLAMILDAQPDMRVLWHAVDGADAICRHDSDAPDILLLDIQMPNLDGLAVTKRLIMNNTASKIIILTTFDTDEHVLTAVESGAAGFLVKNTNPGDVISAIHTVHGGDAVISPGPTRRLFTTFRLRQSRPSASASLAGADVADQLTPRERDIIARVAAGMTNQEICDDLWLTMPTVKTHIGNLLAKTQSRDRVQLALFALRCGLAELP
ncbi:response regulator transcription factor [Brevibacterium luteolum]|uniref:response regulator n=1 Tax=Brevibacterium luteolum TaxID=199591 RepID=UPI001C23671C|nr:response regulator transcription factor [Brevibacterium luteolum]MBU8580057.1 response regulator transcription factor [Brevibacterium luteolum]